MEYAEPDDIHIRKSGGKSGATHAHNVVLEVMSDTGTIGLLGLLCRHRFSVGSLQKDLTGRTPGRLSFRPGGRSHPVPAEFTFRDLWHLYFVADLVPGRVVGRILPLSDQGPEHGCRHQRNRQHEENANNILHFSVTSVRIVPVVGPLTKGR